MADTSKIFLLFLFLAVEAGAVFIFVAMSTRHPRDEQTEAHRVGYAARGIWFVFLTALMLAAFAATLPVFPYMPTNLAHMSMKMSAENSVDRVPVIAQQFTFFMPSHLPLDKKVVFEVTSRDVNHSFGIYDPKGDIIAQTQAMPDYVNYLEVTFHTPGRYTIRCLEYCGIGHPMMEKQFVVGGNQ